MTIKPLRIRKAFSQKESFVLNLTHNHGENHNV